MQKREINVDFCRIIATLFVIILHIFGEGGILREANPGKATYWVAWFLEIAAYCAVNLFALITGYVMVNRTINIRQIIQLWFQVFFYSVLFSLLFFFFIPETRTIKDIVVVILPVTGGVWWYISSYFAVFFCIPILNTAIHHMQPQMLKRILTVILFGICVVDCIVPKDAFSVNGGYSPIWLIIMYLFGAAIKVYNIKEKMTAARCIRCYLSMIIVTFLSKAVIFTATNLVFGQAKFDRILITYISVTIVFASIFLFLFCLKINIGNQIQKVVRFVAPATLGVYLIHAHPYVFRFLLNDAFAAYAHKPALVMVLYVLATAMGIFLLCVTIEKVRIQLFKLVKISKLCDIIGRKATELYAIFVKE